MCHHRPESIASPPPPAAAATRMHPPPRPQHLAMLVCSSARRRSCNSCGIQHVSSSAARQGTTATRPASTVCPPLSSPNQDPRTPFSPPNRPLAPPPPPPVGVDDCQLPGGSHLEHLCVRHHGGVTASNVEVALEELPAQAGGQPWSKPHYSPSSGRALAAQQRTRADLTQPPQKATASSSSVDG